MTLTAACSCKSLSLAASDPTGVSACHCDDCRKRSGSALGIGTFFSRETVSITGKSTVWTRTADSGNKVHHHFCPTCGTTVFWEAEAYPDLVAIAGGAFDDTSWIKPSGHYFTRSAMNWVADFDALPKYQTIRADADARDNF